MIKRTLAALCLLLALAGRASAQNTFLRNDGTFAQVQGTDVSGGAIFPTPTRPGDLIYWNGSIWTNLPGNNSGTANLQENSSGVPSWASCAPNIQAFTTAGANTYTTPTCNGNLPTSIHVMMVGPGGGAGGTGTGGGAGGAGTPATTFGTSLFTANGGANGVNNPTVGIFPAGGTATGCQITVQGQNGGFDGNTGGQLGVAGGASFYGGAGQTGYVGTVAFTGDSAKTNSGSGGAVGGMSAAVISASSGAAGGYCEGWITSSIAASYSVTVGTKGAGGTAGTSGSAGGAGADGRITVEARFQ